jgi:hypothetical protein
LANRLAVVLRPRCSRRSARLGWLSRRPLS